MTPAARAQAAIDLLDAWAPGRPMDRILTAWGRRARYAGSKDRAAVADLVYDALRRWRSLAWPESGAGGRARVLALAEEAGALDAWFDGSRHGPAPITAAERARLDARAAGDPAPPEGVRLDLPDWLVGPMRAGLGPGGDAAILALGARAPVDLRVNRRRATPEAARARLAEDGVETEAGPLSPLCLRVTSGARRLRAAGAWLEGWVEVQDAASQAAASFAQVRPGERALDLCAGGGGKALALAAEGAEVTAHDADPARMADLPARAARAGVRVPRAERTPGGTFELVFVDAPCSGSGAWRRNPDAKWALTPARLDELGGVQDAVLATAATRVAPGGRLVYATCSLLEEENGAAVARFLSAPLGAAFRAGETLRLDPRDGGDGFFAVRLWRDD
ncbi:MAG TPA: RsmB/NOP family class I SAM-dependent RNA methyltransferase [Paracoccaceae bacterium]|nr:RsmB/NOP family class I SAM-dependent RNA methyltransferase [Paracoccaceae bacterium]